MKRKIIIALVLILVGLIMAVGFHYLKNHEELKSDKDVAKNWRIQFNNELKGKKSTITKIIDKTETEKYDYDIYTYGGEVNVIIDDEVISFRDALLDNKITIDELIQKAKDDVENGIAAWDMYQDGGSQVYKYGPYQMIKCNRLDGNRDFYIGIPEMTLNDVL